MALNLDLTYAQSNDAVTLTVTDSTGEYTANNLTGWGGAGGNETYTDIIVATSVGDGSNHHLTLAVTVTDKDGTETAYDEIDLFTKNGGAFTTAADLTWDLTPADFIGTVSGTAMGAATDKLDDGIYAITYNLVDAATDLVSVDSVVESTIVDGAVRIAVYDKLRQVPTDYDCEDNDRSRDIMEALLSYSYLQSIEASASVSNTSELVTMLYTLDKLVSDGSHYTW